MWNSVTDLGGVPLEDPSTTAAPAGLSVSMHSTSAPGFSRAMAGASHSLSMLGSLLLSCLQIPAAAHPLRYSSQCADAPRVQPPKGPRGLGTMAALVEVSEYESVRPGFFVLVGGVWCVCVGCVCVGGVCRGRVCRGRVCVGGVCVGGMCVLGIE